MTQHSTLAIDGAGEPTISTGSSAVISPEQFATACAQIVQQQSGHEAHKALDQLVTGLLSSLGYSEGMAVFLAAVGPCHEPRAQIEREIAEGLDRLASKATQRGVARGLRVAADHVRAGLYLEERKE